MTRETDIEQMRCLFGSFLVKPDQETTYFMTFFSDKREARAMPCQYVLVATGTKAFP